MTFLEFEKYIIRRTEGTTVDTEHIQVCSKIARSILWKKRIYYGCKLWPVIYLFGGFNLWSDTYWIKKIQQNNMVDVQKTIIWWA